MFTRGRIFALSAMFASLALATNVALGAITQAQVDLLNKHFSPSVAAKVQIGTLIQNAEAVSSSNITDGSIVNADVNAAAAIAFSKLAALTDGNILVGNASNVAVSVNPSGDVDVSNAGAFSIAAGAIVDADINASAAIDSTKLAGFTHTAESVNLLEKMAVVTWAFGTDGGAQATTGLGVTLPDNAIVTKVIEDVTTNCTSAGSGATFKLVLPTDGDLSADVTCDGTNVGVASVLPTGTPVKLTGARELSITIGTEAATAGVARWFVYYVQSI